MIIILIVTIIQKINNNNYNNDKDNSDHCAKEAPFPEGQKGFGKRSWIAKDILLIYKAVLIHYKWRYINLAVLYVY